MASLASSVRRVPLFLLVLLLTAGAAQAQDVVVNDTPDPGVPGCESGDAPFDAATVNGGIATAASGQTVFVCPGTYAEEVNIAKAITLNGPYAGTAFNGQSSDRGNEAVIQPLDGAGAAIHIGASNVTIDGVTLDGENDGDAQRDVFFGVNNLDTTTGLYETVTGFTLTNSIVKDFQAYGVFICNGTRNCTGTRSDAETGMTTGGAVTNNRFEGIDGISTADGDPFDFAGRAISMETDGIIETITGNVIRTRSPATDQRQFGIQTGNQGRESNASALTVTIANNDVVVDDVAIWVNNHGGSVPAVQVQSNQATGAEGIRLLNLDVSAGLDVADNTVVADTLGLRAQNLTTGAGTPLSISNNTLTFPNGQEFDSARDSDTDAGNTVGEQVVGMQLSTLSGPQAIAFDDNVFGVPGTPNDGPFYGYTLFNIQADVRTVLRQTTAGTTVNGTQQGVFVMNTIDFTDGFGSLYGIDGLVMDHFTGSSLNSNVNFHAGVFVFSTLDNPDPLDGEIRNVIVRNTGVAGGTSGGQSSAGLYFGDFGSTANVRQQTTVEGVTLEGNDNRGAYLRGLGAQASITQSTLTNNGDRPYTAGGNFGFSVISRTSGTLSVSNSAITGPSTVTTSGSASDNSVLHASARQSSSAPLARLTVTESVLDRNGVGSYAGGNGTVDASLNAWQNGTSAFVNPGATASIGADYSPFLTSGDADSSTDGFQADRSTLTTDSGSPQVQSSTRIEEAAGLGGSTAVRLEQTSGSYSVPADVTLQGDLVLPQNLSFGTVAGALQIVNAELVVDPSVTSVQEGTGTPIFDVQNRFVGTDGAGNDAGWRLLSAPRASVTGADLDNTLDFSTSSGSILHRWDGAAQEFAALDNTAASDLPVGEGFFLYLFDIAGRDEINSTPSSSCTSGDACVRVSGPLDLSASLSTSSSAFGVGDLSVSIPAGGNTSNLEAGYLLGVPYGQSFDLSSLTVDDGGSAVPLGSAGAFRASAQAWNPLTGTFEVITVDESGTGDRLAPWQGFWILRQSNTANDAQTLTFNASGRTRGAPFIPAKSTLGAPARTGRLQVHARLHRSDGTVRAQSHAVLYARDGASLGADAYDAPRIAPPLSAYTQVSFVRDSGHRMAQTSLPYEPGRAVEVPMHVEAVGLRGTVTLSASGWDTLPEGWTLMLTDTETGTTLPLTPDAAYSVSLDGRAATGNGLGGIQTDPVEPRFRLTVTPDDALPVELATFTGHVDDTDALLAWTTASEVNNAGFRVQHKKNGRFTTVATVDGAGTTSSPTDYNVRIPNLDYGEHIFRLVQIDADGTPTPSTELALRVQLGAPLAVTQMAPNPVSHRGRLKVAVRETQPVAIQIYDLLGRRVQTVHDGPLDGRQTHTFNVSAEQLPSGMYFVRVQGTSAAATHRFTVVR